MAKKLICNLPNASNNISGIAFEPYEQGGMISVNEVDDRTAYRFLKIKGYSVVDVAGGDNKGGGVESAVQSNKSDKKAKTDSAQKSEVTANE